METPHHGDDSCTCWCALRKSTWSGKLLNTISHFVYSDLCHLMVEGKPQNKKSAFTQSQIHVSRLLKISTFCRFVYQERINFFRCRWSVLVVIYHLRWLIKLRSPRRHVDTYGHHSRPSSARLSWQSWWVQPPLCYRPPGPLAPWPLVLWTGICYPFMCH